MSLVPGPWWCYQQSERCEGGNKGVRPRRLVATQEINCVSVAFFFKYELDNYKSHITRVTNCWNESIEARSFCTSCSLFILLWGLSMLRSKRRLMPFDARLNSSSPCPEVSI